MLLELLEQDPDFKLAFLTIDEKVNLKKCVVGSSLFEVGSGIYTFHNKKHFLIGWDVRENAIIAYRRLFEPFSNVAFLIDGKKI